MLTIRYNLVQTARFHRGHRRKHSTNQFLVVLGNISILLDYLGFHWTEITDLFLASKDEDGVDAKTRNRRKVGGIRVSSPPFIAALGVPIHSAGLCQVLLTQT